MATITATKTFSSGTFKANVTYTYTYTVSNNDTSTTVTVSKLTVGYNINRNPTTAAEETAMYNAEQSLTEGRATSISFAGTTIYSATRKEGTYTINKSASVTKGTTSTTKALTATGNGVSNSANINVGAKTSYPITYNANGGTGAPTGEVKWYNDPYTISSTEPTQTNYLFQGWATSSTGEVAYRYAGTNPIQSTYTTNAALTLYAVWSQVYSTPQVTLANTGVYRCDSSGTANDEGSYVAVESNFQIWNTTQANTVSALSCTVTSTTHPSYTAQSKMLSSQELAVLNNALTTSGNWRAGTFTFVVNAGVSTEYSYAVTVSLTDSKGGSPYSNATGTATSSLGSAFYIIDVKAGGTGICFGGPAKDDGFFSRMPINIMEPALGSGAASSCFIVQDPSNFPTSQGTAPSANFFGDLLAMRQDDLDRVHIRAVAPTDGRQGVQLETSRVNSSNTTTHHGLQLFIAADGTRSVTLSDAAAWLKALGAAVTYTEVKADVITAASGITITSAAAAKWGRLVTIHFNWTRSSAISVPASGNITNITIGTIAAAYRPYKQTTGSSWGDGAGNMSYYINSAGTVQLCACEGTGSARSLTVNSDAAGAFASTWLCLNV